MSLTKTQISLDVNIVFEEGKLFQTFLNIIEKELPVGSSISKNKRIISYASETITIMFLRFKNEEDHDRWSVYEWQSTAGIIISIFSSFIEYISNNDNNIPQEAGMEPYNYLFENFISNITFRPSNLGILEVLSLLKVLNAADDKVIDRYVNWKQESEDLENKPSEEDVFIKNPNMIDAEISAFDSTFAERTELEGALPVDSLEDTEE